MSTAAAKQCYNIHCGSSTCPCHDSFHIRYTQ